MFVMRGFAILACVVAVLGRNAQSSTSNKSHFPRSLSGHFLHLTSPQYEYLKDQPKAQVSNLIQLESRNEIKSVEKPAPAAQNPGTDLDKSVIQLRSVSYGRNCQGFQPLPEYDQSVVQAISTECASKPSCTFKVYNINFGDGSDRFPGCDKDFVVEYACSHDPLGQVHAVKTHGANGRTLVFGCSEPPTKSTTVSQQVASTGPVAPSTEQTSAAQPVVAQSATAAQQPAVVQSTEVQPQPVVAQPVAAQPEQDMSQTVVVRSVVPQPAATKQIAAQPVAAEPVVAQPVAAQQPAVVQSTEVQPQPVVAQPEAKPEQDVVARSVPQPAATKQIATQPVAEQPVAAEPVAAQPVAAQPVAAQPVAAQPVAAQPVAAQPVAAQPVAAQPVAAQPVAAQPVAAQPVAAQPVTPQPVAVQPVTIQPAAQPVAVQPEAPPATEVQNKVQALENQLQSIEKDLSGVELTRPKELTPEPVHGAESAEGVLNKYEELSRKLHDWLLAKQGHGVEPAAVSQPQESISTTPQLFAPPPTTETPSNPNVSVKNPESSPPTIQVDTHLTPPVREELKPDVLSLPSEQVPQVADVVDVESPDNLPEELSPSVF